MNIASKSFAIFNPSGHQRYLRDLFYRMARDEELTDKSKGDAEFYIVVLTEKEFQELQK